MSTADRVKCAYRQEERDRPAPGGTPPRPHVVDAGQAVPTIAITPTITIRPGGALPTGTTAGVEGPDGRARSSIVLELTWLAFLVWIYDWLEDLAPLRRKLAFANAHRILSFEQNIGLDPERALDHWLSHQTVLAFLASNIYSNAIFAVTFGFAAYVWWWRPDLYRPLRYSLILANMMAFAVFLVVPVAPPRMLSGFVDVVQTAGGLGAWHDTLIKYADQFAAMPSMHLGYAVWCSVVAWRIARRPAAKVAAVAFGAVYPVLTAVIVLATGNHYLLDVLAGTAVTVLAVLIVEQLVPRAAALVRAMTRPMTGRAAAPAPPG
jgi:hypothetical protein